MKRLMPYLKWKKHGERLTITESPATIGFNIRNCLDTASASITSLQEKDTSEPRLKNSGTWRIGMETFIAGFTYLISE